MKKIDSFPGKTLGLLADLNLKLQHGGRTTEELERFLKGEPLFHEFFTIPVDRSLGSVMPIPPSGCGPYKPKPLFKKLHGSGPTELEISRIVLDYQVGRGIGHHRDSLDIRSELVATRKIELCLNLRDGEELARHLKYFPANWSGKRLVLWKSICVDQYDRLYVPSLFQGGSRINWEYMAQYPDFLPTALYV